MRPATITYDRENSSFATADAHAHDWDALLEGADLLHLSGITAAVSESAGQAALALRFSSAFSVAKRAPPLSPKPR